MKRAISILRSTKQSAGIRLHYERYSPHPFYALEKAGYRYDSTEYAFRDPYRIGQMWEFPFQIMDGWIIQGKGKWQQTDLSIAKERTMREIDKAQKMQIKYLGIDFHDRYFSHAFKTWLDWYMWLVDYLRSYKMEFINFDTVVKELESGNEYGRKEDLAI